MVWFIDDYSRTEILITNLWQEFIVPKFRLELVVNEPILTINWSDSEKGQVNRRSLSIDYLDVVDGYSGYADNPSSAADLAQMIQAMIDSAWTDITGGGTLTADEIAAIQNGDSPNAGNPFVTESALTAALTASGVLFTPDLFSNGEELGIGTNRTLTSLGYSNGTAAIAWPLVAADARFTIDVTTMFIDWVALQEMCLTMETTCNSYAYSPGGRAYMVNQSVLIPRNQENWTGSGSAGTRSLDEFVFYWSGSGIFNGTTDNFPTLDRFPADQTEAVSDFLNTSFFFHEMWIGGNSADLTNVNNIPLRLAATTKSKFVDCTFVNGVAVAALYFGIGCSFDNCQFYNWGTYGLLLSNGRDGDAFGGGWTGGGTSDCQTNETIVNNCRFVLTTDTSLAALHQFGGYRTKIENPIVEGIGPTPETVHLFHYLASGDGVEQLFDIDGLSVENLTCTRAGVRSEAEKGDTHIGKCAFYLGSPGTQMPVSFEADNRTGSSSRPRMFIADQSVNRPYRSIENTATPSFQPEWIFTHAAANDPSDIFDPSNWASDLGGFIPDPAYVCWTDMSNCGGGGGTASLEDTLAVGNTTGGTDISVDSGDDIILNGATASEIAGFSASKQIVSLPVATYPSLTELSYVKGVTSAIQGQINAKQATITGGATTIVSSNLTASRALASDGSGKVAVSGTSATELGYVTGVTSAIQTQLNTKYVTLFAQFLSTNYQNNVTRYFGNHPRALQGSADQSKIYIRTTGSIKIAEFYTYANGVAGTNENISLNIRLNNTSDTLIQTVGVAAAERIFTNSSLNIAVTAGDYIELKLVLPTFGTIPTTVTGGGTIYILPT